MASLRPRLANVYGHNVGTGLTRHIAVVAECLRAAGYEVAEKSIPIRRRGARLDAYSRRLLPSSRRADINLFIQELVPSAFRRARTNVFLPTQEWFDPRDLRLLPGVDHILCTSQHAEDIFSWRGPAVTNLGFTCIDRLDSDSGTANRRERVLHVAGRSPYKGTAVLRQVWQRHPEWPTLTIVRASSILDPLNASNIDERLGHLDDTQLKQLQNDSWLHVFPTEAEAFGHSLCEGLSVGALVIATDAPPMNELIRPDRGVLIPCTGRQRLNLGWRFFVDAESLEDTLEQVFALGPRHFSPQMSRARSWFVANDARFRSELTAFFTSL